MKWMHFIKNTGANKALSAETYIPITKDIEYLLEKDEYIKDRCEQWAELVNTEGNYSQRGFEYEWEIVDHPPSDWLSKEIVFLNKEKDRINEQIQLYVDTLIQIK